MFLFPGRSPCRKVWLSLSPRDPPVSNSPYPPCWMTNAPQFPHILHGCRRLSLGLLDCMTGIFLTGLYPTTSCNLEIIQLGKIFVCVRERDKWKLMVTSFLRLKHLGEIWHCGKVDLRHYRENIDYDQSLGWKHRPCLNNKLNWNYF